MTEESSKSSKWMVGLGEILWDILPAGERLGGAAANFAVMASQLGARGILASRLGDDDPGRRARSGLARFSLDTSFLQTDPDSPTGSVSVTFNGGQPQYSIPSAVAWDFLELTEQWLELARRADAVCFGTLAQRSSVSRRTIQGFLAATSPRCARILDVNLRPPFYSAGILEHSLNRATLLKMNDAEAPQVLALLGLGNSPVTPKTIHAVGEAELLAMARKLLERFPLELVCITMGEGGSLLVTRNEWHRHPGIVTRVADTVGAGDAFAAAMTFFYLRKASLSAMNEAANRWGSWVASQPGAMPRLHAASFPSIAPAMERGRGT